MSTARGFANHALYMATIQLEAWQQAADAGSYPANALDAAFAPAVQHHLLDAFGWFLLAMTRQTQLPASPPHATQLLPDLGPGIAVPGEIAEYRQLEEGGWLGELQRPLPPGLPRRPRGPVLATVGLYPGIGDFRDWFQQLETLFVRMSDSLDEY